ncbi:MAG: exo-alpha-sialidase [Verrucomicrobia bacterium]|nr:exo-alpha-sialidase [Verrucomicrobiota bacterium]
MSRDLPARWLGLAACALHLGAAGTELSPGDPARDRLPPALRGADLDRLSSGAYWMLFGGSEGLRAGDRMPGRSGLAHAGGAGAAVLDPKVGPNTRLGDDPEALPANYRAQAEPHVARSVTDANLMVAIFQEGRFSDGGAVNCGYAISLDGGGTWRRGLIPHLIASLDGGPFTRASDPVACVDLQNHVYLNTLAIVGEPPNLRTTIVLSKSVDLGQTFSRPLTVLTNADPKVFLDKNWMSINTFAGSPTAGRIAATCTRFTTLANGVQITPIAVTYSDDGGTNWSHARVVSPDFCQGSLPVFLPDGSLAVVYWNFAGPTGDQIEVAVSNDGGETFAAPRLVTPVRLYSDPVARAGGFLPAAATDSGLGVLYVTYQTDLGGPRVMFTRSRDQGRTWTAPRPVNDTPAGKAVFNPAVAVSPDGQHVTIVFYDKRHDPGGGYLVDLYLAESFDGGETWEPNVRVSDVSSDLRLAPLAPVRRMVGDYHGLVPAWSRRAPGLAVWVDTRTGSPDPFAATLTRTRGATFEAWRRLAFSAVELSDPARSAATADPDRDGWPNLLEYGLGRRPLAPESTPAVRVEFAVDGPAPWTLAIDSIGAAEDIAYVWRCSLDLYTWESVRPAVVDLLPGPTPDRQRHRARFEPASMAAEFFTLGAMRVVPGMGGSGSP